MSSRICVTGSGSADPRGAPHPDAPDRHECCHPEVANHNTSPSPFTATPKFGAPVYTDQDCHRNIPARGEWNKREGRRVFQGHEEFDRSRPRCSVRRRCPSMRTGPLAMAVSPVQSYADEPHGLSPRVTGCGRRGTRGRYRLRRVLAEPSSSARRGRPAPHGLVRDPKSSGLGL
jgi:hypothetical protein